MTTTLRPLSVNAHGTWSSQVEEKSKHLDGLTPIISAVVIPVRQASDKPAFRVQVRLEVPGPGLHAADKRRKRRILLLLQGRALRAEAIGNTLKAALLKATEYLEHQVEARQLRRTERGISKLQPGGVTSRWTSTQMGQKTGV